MNALLDEIDEGYAERNEAEDILRKQQEVKNLPNQLFTDQDSATENNSSTLPDSQAL